MRPDAGALRLHPALSSDAAVIADLHARSWRAAYRGALSDAYLDGPVVAERQRFWTNRLGHPPPGLWTLLAEREGALAGFACALVEHDARWGTLVDNLHADPNLKRQGIGRTLLAALGRHLQDIASQKPVHLFVLRTNTAAAAFYAALGGETVETMVKTEPDGSALPVARIAWPSAAALAETVA